MDTDIILKLSEKYKSIYPFLDERSKRIWAASEAKSIGRGGINAVRAATGMGYFTIKKGFDELENSPTSTDRIRQSGGGRKKKIETDTTLLQDLQTIVEPITRGDPTSPLLWTSKSLTKIVKGLKEKGHVVGITSVRKLLKQLGYSLQSNRKRREGEDHPDRNVQFEYINKHVKEQISKDEPVISVDTKKKENIGNYSNKGQEYQPKGQPVETKMHDFPDKKKGKAIPYGIYDMINNTGFVNVGVDHDTAEFAVHSIRTWWYEMGKERFPNARTLTITADCGGSNSSHSKLWKVELQKLSNEIGLDIVIHHFPPGTSKWNKVEHRLFSYISKNWRGRPLIDLVTIVNLIANTKTESGLLVRCVEDKKLYAKGIKVSNEELKNVTIEPATFHADWNYTIKTKMQKQNK
jgi:transposase